MASEIIADLIRQIFDGRRYCTHCGSMTPVIVVRYEWTYEDECEICKQLYEGYVPMKWGKIYGKLHMIDCEREGLIDGGND